jgi:hypothetical protein
MQRLGEMVAAVLMLPRVSLWVMVNTCGELVVVDATKEVVAQQAERTSKDHKCWCCRAGRTCGCRQTGRAFRMRGSDSFIVLDPTSAFLVFRRFLLSSIASRPRRHDQDDQILGNGNKEWVMEIKKWSLAASPDGQHGKAKQAEQQINV